MLPVVHIRITKCLHMGFSVADHLSRELLYPSPGQRLNLQMANLKQGGRGQSLLVQVHSSGTMQKNAKKRSGGAAREAGEPRWN